MTRELDVEIAIADGCKPKEVTEGDDTFWRCRCPKAEHWERGNIPHYSTDLNALMALIRRRWPGPKVELWDSLAQIVRYDDSDQFRGVVRSAEGDTDAERLAHAVKAALEAERE